jgi:Rod binding domain-containing protein
MHGIDALAGGTEAIQTETGRLLSQAEAGSSSKQDTKIDKAAQDFESILLTSWLEKAESSFGSVPGGGDDDSEDGDGDPGKGQLQAIAVQALGSALAADGGIGIARMIATHLKAAAHKQSAATSATPAGPGTHNDTSIKEKPAED